MKKYMLLSLVSGGLLFLSAPVVLAAQPAQVPVTQAASTAAESWVDISTVVQNLEGAGYPTIEKIKRGSSAYKAEVFDKAGKEYKVSLDPKTGKITEAKAERESTWSSSEAEKYKAKPISTTDALGKIKAAGYRDIYELETESGFYEVNAFDTKGKKVKLTVDGATGAVTPIGHKFP